MARTRADIEKDISELKKLRDEASRNGNKKQADFFESQITLREEELNNLLEEEAEKQAQMTTTGRVLGTVGRIGGVVASFVVGEVDACVTGKVDEDSVKRKRAKVAAAGEKSGAFIGNMLEKGVKGISGYMKGRKK